MSKSVYILIILVFIMFFPTYVNAYAGQYSWDPIYVEVKTDPITDALKQNSLMQQQNNILEANIRTSCGVYFWECYQQYCSNIDIGNAASKSSCLTLVPSCCERKKSAPQPTPDELCVQKYGVNSKYDGYYNGRYECSCKAGFEFNTDHTACIKFTPDRSCFHAYGAFSKYAGRLNNSGGYVCECKSNFEFVEGIDNGKKFTVCGCKEGEYNDDFTGCKKTEVPAAQQLTPDEVCAQNYGIYSKYAGYLNEKGGYRCECRPGYEFNAKNSVCVKIETPILTPDQSCVNTFGAHFKYAGSLGSTGGYQCDCESGYEVKYESGRYTCDCQAGYQWNANNTACVKVVTPMPSKPPSNKPADVAPKQIKSKSSAKKAPIKNIPAISTIPVMRSDTVATGAPKIIPAINKKGVVKNFIFSIGSFFKSIFR